MRFKIDGTRAFCIITTIFVIAVMIGFYYTTTSSANLPDDKTLEKIQKQVNMNNKMKEIIQIAHFKINDTVCWGNWELLKNNNNYSAWNRTKEKLPTVIKKTQKARELATNKYTKKDLTEALELLRKGSDQNNVDLLIKAHRILHDLDRFVFNPVDGKKYFGVTKLIENNPGVK